MDILAVTAAERRAVADILEGLNEQQWNTPSLCGEWTVRDVAAHLVMPHVTSMPTVAKAMIKARGNFDKANVAMTAVQSARPTADLIADLRAHADGRFKPPGATPVTPMTDVLVHTQDMMIPLGIGHHADPAAWHESVQMLASPAGRRGFVSKPLPAVQWIADDVSWRHGSGPVVEGSAESIALVMCGRRPGLDGLRGEGVPVVSAWL